MTGAYITTAILDTAVLGAVLALAIYSKNWWAWTVLALSLPIAIWGLT